MAGFRFERKNAGKRWNGSAFLFLILGILAGNLAGCAAASVAGDASGEVLGKSEELIRRGKVETDQPVPIADAIEIVQRAADELKLNSAGHEKHPDQVKLIYRDDRKQMVVVTIVRRTEVLTEIHTDVGFLGPESLGRAVMRQILDDLPPERPHDAKSLN